MSSKKTIEEIREHKQNVINQVSYYVEELIQSEDLEINKKADKFCYWLDDYVKFLKYEKSFKPDKLRRYKRGEIIKVHLGYNIGSEEGGLHYCVVLDKNNTIYSPCLTVIPLTSVKESTDLNKLHKGVVNLGNELFTSLSSKISIKTKDVNDQLEQLAKAIVLVNDKYIDKQIPDKDEIQIIRTELKELESKIYILKKKKASIDKMKKEINKIKKGSLALTNQITTISKIRIFDPKTNSDVLSNVKLSNEKLDLIDEQIGKNYSNLLKNQ